LTGHNNAFVLQESKKRHSLLVSRLEKIRVAAERADPSVIPVDEIRKTHNNIVSKIERFRRGDLGNDAIGEAPQVDAFSEPVIGDAPRSDVLYEPVIGEAPRVDALYEPVISEAKKEPDGQTIELADKLAGAFLEASAKQKPVPPAAPEGMPDETPRLEVEPAAPPAQFMPEVETKAAAEVATEKSAPETDKTPEQTSQTNKAPEKPAPDKAAPGILKVKYPIAFKLVAIVAALLIISLSAITVLVSALVSSDVQLTAEDNNFSINTRVSESSAMALENVRSSTLSLLNDIAVIDAAGRERAENLNDMTDTASQEAANFFFKQNRDILAIAILSADGRTSLIVPNISQTFINDSQFSAWLDGEEDAARRARGGETVLLNAAPFFDMPVLAMLLPLASQDVNQNGSAAAVFYSTEDFMEMYKTGLNISFLLNTEGDVLAHADKEMVMGAVNLRRIPFVENALFNTGRNVQTLYADETGTEYFGVFRRLLNGNAVLITIVKKDDVLGSIQSTTTRNIFISIAVLIVSILIILLFAGNISRPLHSLTIAAQKIEKGQYDLALDHKSGDEIGALTSSFIGMGNGLENFEKFTNKVVVQLARQGKLTRGGVNKKITVCFILIRDFSELSKNMSAAQIVDFVNEYLQLMVPCITQTGGIVDKFLTQGGVVIMALWGTIDSEKTHKENALSCIRSTLMTRACLLDFNRKLHQRFWGYAPLIKIGCGINSGDVVVGQMGSEQRMEYTVIGDTVNLAARIEGPNDLFDTDILISENTWNLVKDNIIYEEMPSIEVKGKEKPLRIFSVINLKKIDDVADMYEELAALNYIGAEHKKNALEHFATNMEEVRALWG
jgi:adenylate cyclase